MKNRAFAIIRAARANFLPASVIPYFLGAFYASSIGKHISIVKFFIGLMGVASMHMAGNLFNDYFDYKSGADSIRKKESPFFGGSGVIQKGIMSDLEILGLALVFSAVAFFCGIGIYTITKNPIFFAFMLVAALLALEYTAPPLRLAYRRLGELDIFLLFGVFLVMGSFYLFNGVFTLGSFLISLPISFLVAAIIICNEIPDYDSDIAAGKYNLIAVTGRDTGYTLYAAAAAFSALALIANIVAGNLPAGAAFILLFYILGVKAALILRDNSSGVNEFIKASMLTIALHSAAGVSMIVALLFKR